MRFAVITVLVALASVCRAQPVIPTVGGAPTEPSISLFVSCDLTQEFVAPGIDAREVLWLGTPVSRAGARALEISRRQCVVAQVPLVLEANAPTHINAIMAPRGAPFNEQQGGIRLLVDRDNHLHGRTATVASRPREARARGWRGRQRRSSR